MYTSPVGNLISAHNLHHHQYADDTQLYMAVRPSVNVTYTGISECVADVSRWFLENGLLLNPTKTGQSCSVPELSARRCQQRVA